MDSNFVEANNMPIPESTEEEADTAITSFIANNSRLAAPSATDRIPYPIVIPQRRPGNKQRGFMKAYAPVLSSHGISQEHFHDFIDALNKATQASKWLAAVQIAAFGASFVPNQISMGVTAAVQIFSAVAAKAQIRWKVNAFLDQANRELFCPRGLYCLIVTYNPLALLEQEDINNSIERGSNGEDLSSSKRKWPAKVAKNLRNPFSATTEGEQHLPSEIAPLIFSEDEDKEAMPKKEKPWEKMNSYLDKRARARYAAESNGDTLSTAPESTFKNRYLDPNHPASNGGLLGLVSGGHLTRDTKKLREDMRDILQQQETALHEQQSCQLELLRGQFQAMGHSEQQKSDMMAVYEQQFELQREQFRSQIKGVDMAPRKIMKDILYLMVVNLPTGEELEAARTAMTTDENNEVNHRSSVAMVNI